MKKIIKLLTLLMVFMLATNSSFALSISKIDKLIKKSDLNETATIAISIKMQIKMKLFMNKILRNWFIQLQH